MSDNKTTSSEIKKNNRNNIYRLIREDGSLTRQDIAYKLNLSLPTVTQNIEVLMSDKLITESGSIGNTGGRRAKTYSIISDAKVAIGLDITANHIGGVIIDLNGDIISSIRERHEFSKSDAYFYKVGNLIKKLYSSTTMEESKVLGVGIGMPVIISEDRKKIINGVALNCNEFTNDELSKYIPYPVELFNDANSAGCAELWKRKNTNNAFYVMLSSSVGGSIIINNRVYTGDNLRSGEIGHTTIIPDGAMCYCGKRGCLNAYCSSTVLSDTSEGSLKLFFDRLKNGDRKAVILWEDYLKHLSYGISNIRVLFDCDIIIGGYIGEYMDNYIESLRKMVLNRNFFDQDASFLSTCIYKKESIAAGAALPFVYDFLRMI